MNDMSFHFEVPLNTQYNGKISTPKPNLTKFSILRIKIRSNNFKKNVYFKQMIKNEKTSDFSKTRLVLKFLI